MGARGARGPALPRLRRALHQSRGGRRRPGPRVGHLGALHRAVVAAGRALGRARGSLRALPAGLRGQSDRPRGARPRRARARVDGVGRGQGPGPRLAARARAPRPGLRRVRRDAPRGALPLAGRTRERRRRARTGGVRAPAPGVRGGRPGDRGRAGGEPRVRPRAGRVGRRVRCEPRGLAPVARGADARGIPRATGRPARGAPGHPSPAAAPTPACASSSRRACARACRATCRPPCAID